MARITDIEKKDFHNIFECVIDKLNTPKNIKKTHWKHLSLNYLKKRLIDEYLELEEAIDIDMKAEKEKIIRDISKRNVELECYDIIGFALFMVDNVRHEERNHKERQAIIDEAVKSDKCVKNIK